MQGLPGVPKLQDGLNPATWMLQISTPGMEKMIGVDFAVAYKSSTTFRRAQQSKIFILLTSKAFRGPRFACEDQTSMMMMMIEQGGFGTAAEVDAVTSSDAILSEGLTRQSSRTLSPLIAQLSQQASSTVTADLCVLSITEAVYLPL